jgi:hypothetical protein
MLWDFCLGVETVQPLPARNRFPAKEPQPISLPAGASMPPANLPASRSIPPANIPASYLPVISPQPDEEWVNALLKSLYQKEIKQFCTSVQRES